MRGETFERNDTLLEHKNCHGRQSYGTEVAIRRHLFFSGEAKEIATMRRRRRS